MKFRTVRTQAELDATLAAGDLPECIGSGEFHAMGSATVRAGGSATVRAWDSATVHAGGSATVYATGSATVRATGSATVHAWDSATVRATGSATVHAAGSATVRATGSATVHAAGSATVHAGQYVAVTIHSKKTVKVTGGVRIYLPEIRTAGDWCDFHGVTVTRGVATLYKALNDDYTSPHGLSYAPGSTPEAPDWDGGKAECGGGLHFSPMPFLALRFHPDAKRFVACPVRVKDICVHPDGMYPEKVKAPRCCGPVWECDIDGNPIGKASGKAKPRKKK